MRKRPLASLCLVVILFFFLAVNRIPAPTQNAHEGQGARISVTGRVQRKELRRQTDRTVQVLYLTDLSGDSPPGKTAACYLKDGQAEPEMGCRVTVEGTCKISERASNPGQFDSYSYDLSSGISYRLNQAVILEKTVKYNRVGEALYRFRRFLSRKLSESLPEKESALMGTILLGEKGELDREWKKQYQRNGIAHILAISGLHVSMLGMGLYRLLRKGGVPMKLSAVLSALLLVLYGMMTGFSVSALRAIFMFSLHMLAVLTERTYDMLTALAVAAVLLLITQPLAVNSSGFVFSCGCVLGIGVLTPALTEGKGEFLRNVLSALSMGVITLPVSLWYTYQFPVWSMFLNLLVIPLMSYLMAAGILLLVMSIFCPFAAGLPALLITGVFRIFECACRVCESLPAHLLNAGKPEIWQILFYLAVLLGIIGMKKKLALPVRWLLVFLAAAVLMLRPGGKLKLTFLDVGQGDGIYMETADGSRFLIDGGSSSVGSVGEYRLIPFLQFQGTGRLDAVFVTHPDTDHCNGVEEILKLGADSGVRVNCLILPDISEKAKNDAYRNLVSLAEQSHVPVDYISRGQTIKKGDMTITCLHPKRGYETEDANASSIVLKVTYGNFSALLTGDLEGAGEESFLEYQKGRKNGEENHLESKQESKQENVQENGQENSRLTVLKAAHHGSAYSTGEEFLERFMPLYTVISCGEKNSYGHPHEELLRRLQECGTNTLITYRSGAITFETDGERVWVKQFLAEGSAADG